jgi:glutamate synthase domain-containing protein 3
VAEHVLASWASEVAHFRKVMPNDYKRVLTVLAEAERDGLSEGEALDRVMAASRG